MLTQALPYTPQQQRPLLPNSNSKSNANAQHSRRFSLRSINSTTSVASTATHSSTQYEEPVAASSAPATEPKSKNFQTFIRSLRPRRRRSGVSKSTTTATTAGAAVEDDEVEMLSPAERPREMRKNAAEMKAKRSSVDSMFSWASMTIYTYPGAAPVAGWF